MAMHWYVLHVYSGFEKKVAEGIREQAEQMGMEDLFEQLLVPTEEVVEMRRGQQVNAERKFFTGYVLMRLEMTDESCNRVKNPRKDTGCPGNHQPTTTSSTEDERLLTHGQGGRSGKGRE